MKKERKFLRLCVSCRKYKKKDELIRITKDHNSGKIIINEENKIQGRSFYVCKQEECVEKITKNKKIFKAIDDETGKNIKEELYTVLKK